jgi:nitroreductase
VGGKMAEFIELLRTRRSIRDFEDKAVPQDLVLEIINESCLAPSAQNGQPWRFIIINNKEWIWRLSDESKKNLLAFIKEHPDAPIKKYETALRDRDFNVFYNAPCLVYIGGSKKNRTLQVDCALAACYFMFSAVARGLGTCWIGLGMNIEDPELRKHVGMPEDYRIVAPIILGYPKSVPKPPERSAPQILRIVS